MRNKLLGFVLVGAAVGALFAACGDETTPGPTACTSDSSCQTGEICHPTAKICVASCTGATDCPSEAKNCDSLTVNGVTSGKFCQCSTTALCGGGTGSSTICAAEDKICTTKCSDDSACGTGRSCVDGDCKTTGGGTDGGSCTPACAANETCGTGKTCAATACNSSNPQPDACKDGTQCTGSACALLPAASCPNVSGHGATFQPGDNAPVIYDIQKTLVETNTTFCPGSTNNKRVKVHVKAYYVQGTFPSCTNGTCIEPLLHYIRADGSEGTTSGTLQNSTLSNGGHNVEFDQNFCAGNNATSLGIADHFQQGTVAGNVFCAQFSL